MTPDPIEQAIEALDYMLDYASLTDKAKAESVAPIKAHQALMALRQHQKDGGWLPIETAPKDGTLIDLWVVCNKGSQCFRAENYAYDQVYEVFAYRGDGRESLQSMYGWKDIKATHWRSIPPAPKKENDDG